MVSFGPDESHMEGRLAYLAGRRSDTNPYERGTRQYQNWRAGWVDEAMIDAVTCGTDDGAA
jgi:hypothetical protein